MWFKAVGYYSRAGRALRRLEQKKTRASKNGPSNGDRIKWTIDDLPRGIDRNKWNVFMVPHFLSYFARNGEPWESNHYLEHAQKTWVEYFPDCPHVLTQNEDAVYPLVCHFRFIFAFIDWFFIIAAPALIWLSQWICCPCRACGGAFFWNPSPVR